MDQHKYKVVFEDFTKRHFIKNFEKKYKSQWNKTQDDIIFVCEHIENMLLTKRADLISVADNYRLVKLDFAIFGLKISPKSSGNRCILLLDDDMRIVKVLLVQILFLIPVVIIQQFNKLIGLKIHRCQ